MHRWGLTQSTKPHPPKHFASFIAHAIGEATTTRLGLQ